MTKKNLFTLVLCLFCFGTTTHAQHIPTLEEAVYGGLIKTEGGSNVSWMKDGERYSKIEKNAEGAYEVTAYKAKDNSKEVLIPANMLLNPQTGNLNVIPQPQEVSQDIQAHPFVINPQP